MVFVMYLDLNTIYVRL